jgi:hypothetical protein
MLTTLLRLFAVTLLLAGSVLLTAADRTILLIAGPPSHGPLAHEQNAAALLFKKWLNGVPGIKAAAQLNGWPDDESALATADAIFVFCDGAERHLIFQGNRAEAVAKAAARGAGLVFYHYGVEPPKEKGHREFLDWIGGYFELNYSVNPIWEADIKALPKHQIARGVKPFKVRDEWYFNMRFRDGMRGVTPILEAVPPPETVNKPDGVRSSNPDVRSKAGQRQALMWATERPDGGRGVGFTGGHFHLNLGDENFRKVMLNALVWAAKGKVPAQGVSVNVTDAGLRENLDPKPGRK